MEIRDLLAEIDRLKAEIDVLRPIDPAQERRIMQKFRLDWTYHSNAIEGNTLTYGETKAFLLHGVTAQGKPFRDYLEVRGHHEAINYLLEFVRQQNPLTEADIRELHKMILVEPYEVDAVTADGRATTRLVTPGQYKSAPNHVITSTGEMHYYATPEETPAKMGDLMAWFRRETEKVELHPLILAATFHYQFVVIHPFDDGNGRMARLLMNLLLMQYGYPPVIIPLDKKGEYLLALETADADNNLDPFISHIGKGLLNSLDLFIRGAKGESIESIDDIDKKLRILGKKVLSIKASQWPEKNTDILSDFLSLYLEPLLRLLFSKLVQFDTLFSQTSYRLEFFEEESSRPNLESYRFESNLNLPKVYEEITRFIKTLIKQVNLRQIRIIYGWERFTLDTEFSLGLYFDFVLKTYEFEIYSDECILDRGTFVAIPSTPPSSPIFIGHYNIAYSEEEVYHLLKPILDYLVKVIEDQTSKSQFTNPL